MSENETKSSAYEKLTPQRKQLVDQVLANLEKSNLFWTLTDLLVCGECGSPYRRKTYSRKGVNQRVWRCLSRLENYTSFCADSVTVDDEKIKQAVMRGISSAVKDRKDVLDLILSDLEYAVTGQDGAFGVYALEKQLKALNDIMDETMEIAANSSGDGKRFQKEIKALSEQMVVIREQIEMAKEKIHQTKKSIRR